jgi:hypothetical protein
MRSILTSFIVFLIVSLGAQEYKCKPNSCTYKEAGKYILELAACDNYLEIYVLDSQLKPAKINIITGFAEFSYMDETFLITYFTRFSNTNLIKAKIPGPGFYNCRVSLEIDGDLVNAFFDNECDLRAGIKQRSDSQN